MRTLKQTIVLCVTFFSCTAIYSQRFLFNIGGGMMNYGGDLQKSVFTFNQANKAFEGGLSYKFSDYFTLSASITTGKVAASDAKTNLERARRNLSFYTKLTEESITLKFDLRQVPGIFKFTPYIFGGVGLFHFNPYAYDTLGEKVYLQPLGTEGQGLPQYPNRQPYKLTQFSIPFGGGLSYAISDNIIISGELGFRLLFTDYLDDVSGPYYADTSILRAEKGGLSAKMSFRSDETYNPFTFNDKLIRGNPTKKDVYYTALIKLSFSLGGSGSDMNNWYSRKARKQCGCPGKVL
jgi:hypothetical protein